MKRISNYLVMFLALTGIIFLASCDEDTELPSADPEISLGLTNGDTVVHEPGSNVMLAEVSISNYSTGELEVTQSTNGEQIDGSPFSINDNGNVASTITYALPEDMTGTIELTFDLVDGNEMLASKTLVVQVMYGTVVDVAENATEPSFSILVEALQVAELESTLQGDGPFTVFAPTDEAFEAFFTEHQTTKDEFLARGDLADILQYHVLGGNVMAGDLSDGQKAETLQGDSISVSIEGDQVSIDFATVVNSDMVAGNGVVHSIDWVLLPPRVMHYEAKLLYAPDANNSNKTFFSTNTGETYSRNDVENTDQSVSPNIDFGYYYGSNDNASLAAPANYPSDIYDLEAAGWNTLNATEFRTSTLTPEGFDDIQEYESAELASEFEVGGDPEVEGRAIDLSADNVVAFKTDNGKDDGAKFGLIKVVAIVDGNGDGEYNGVEDYLEIEVKVAQ